MIGRLNILRLSHKDCHVYALADDVISADHNIKWEHFDILATGKSDLQCKINETLLIIELKPSLSENVSSEKQETRHFLLRETIILLISTGSSNYR